LRRHGPVTRLGKFRGRQPVSGDATDRNNRERAAVHTVLERDPMKAIPLLVSVWLVAGGSSASVSEAGLAQGDDKKLTADLQAISSAWVQEAVNSANQILWKPEYTSQHWREFFSTFFKTNPFTEDLRNYLGYPVFGWGPESAHVELQEGIAVSIEELVARLIERHGNRLGNALNADPVLLETLCKATGFLNRLAGSKDICQATRERLYRFHQELIAGCSVLSASHTIDISKHPYLGRIRGQIFMNLVSFALRNVADPQARTLGALSPHIRGEIASGMSLQGQRLDIWQKHALLVIDNNGLDTQQLSAISRLLDLVPPQLHNLSVVTVWEFLGERIDRFQCVAGCVNIGGVNIGKVKENGFPADVSPYHADLFWLIWAHEFNHNVDHYHVGHDDPHRKRLIERAGSVSRNYLRSMFNDNTFVKAPQEFFASISNQYFANSNHTLKLALVRFDEGIKDPLRQFLFFVDVYSLKGYQSYFYELDTRGRFERQTVFLTRDANGFISGLSTNEKHYQFDRDNEGAVIEYREREP
jgi:hypothetical protein